MDKRSNLEWAIFNASWGYSQILGRLHGTNYYLSTKKFPSDITTFSIKPQKGHIPHILSSRRYPGIMYISDGLIRFDDNSSPVNRRYMKYLQREIPELKFISE
jgi:hypothetical protein